MKVYHVQSAMRIVYRLTREEYVEASHVAGQRAGSEGRLLRWGGYVVVAFGFLLWVSRPDGGGWLAPVTLTGFGLLVLIYPVWSAYTALERYWRDVEADIPEVTLDVEADGLRYQTPTSHHQYRWSAFREITESRQLFLFYMRTRDLSFMVPKRAVPDLTEFRRLLAQAVPGAPPPNQPRGFPVVVREQGAEEYRNLKS